jgi:hypothetical protein
MTAPSKSNEFNPTTKLNQAFEHGPGRYALWVTSMHQMPHEPRNFDQIATSRRWQPADEYIELFTDSAPTVLPTLRLRLDALSRLMHVGPTSVLQRAIIVSIHAVYRMSNLACVRSDFAVLRSAYHANPARAVSNT